MEGMYLWMAFVYEWHVSVDGKCLWIACVYRKYLSACVYGRYMSVDGICLWMARICGHVSMVSMCLW